MSHLWLIFRLQSIAVRQFRRTNLQNSRPLQSLIPRLLLLFLNNHSLLDLILLPLLHVIDLRPLARLQRSDRRRNDFPRILLPRLSLLLIAVAIPPRRRNSGLRSTRMRRSRALPRAAALMLHWISRRGSRIRNDWRCARRCGDENERGRGWECLRAPREVLKGGRRQRKALRRR